MNVPCSRAAARGGRQRSDGCRGPALRAAVFPPPPFACSERRRWCDHGLLCSSSINSMSGAQHDPIGHCYREVVVADRSPISVVPANQATWEDIEAVVGKARAGTGCASASASSCGVPGWRATTVDERAQMLREQTDCGYPRSDFHHRAAGVRRRRAGRLVLRRTAPRAPAHPGAADLVQAARPGSHRRARMGRRLLRHTNAVPVHRRQPHARQGGCRVRP